MWMEDESPLCVCVCVCVCVYISRLQEPVANVGKANCLMALIFTQTFYNSHFNTFYSLDI